MKILQYAANHNFTSWSVWPARTPRSRTLWQEGWLYYNPSAILTKSRHLVFPFPYLCTVRILWSTGPTGSWGCRSCSPGWRELCCSTGCCCPKPGSCWNCPHHRCHWPHQTAYSPVAWSAAHPRPRTPLPSEWAHPPPSRPAGDSKGCKHYPRNTGEGDSGVEGTR